MAEIMLSLIVGLGNIGGKYQNTRHNIGFMVVDKLAAKNKSKWRSFFFKPYDRAEIEYEAHKIVMAKPKKYMNRSGLVIKALLQKMKISPEQILVLVDDFNIPLGSLRFRRSGSDGGHNGLSSIIESIGTQDFPRLRLGIGPLEKGLSVVDFVLGDFRVEEKAKVEKMIADASEAVCYAAVNGLDEAMARYNKVNPA